MPPPPRPLQRPSPLCLRCVCGWVALFAECPPPLHHHHPPAQLHTREAQRARLIRLIPMPVMIARHLFLMTGAYQRTVKHATSKACSQSSSVSDPVGGTSLVFESQHIAIVGVCVCVHLCYCRLRKKEHVFSLASAWPLKKIKQIRKYKYKSSTNEYNDHFFIVSLKPVILVMKQNSFRKK